MPWGQGGNGGGGRSPAQMMTKRERRNLRIGLTFILPWLLGFMVFTLYPIGASLYYSLCDFRVVQPPHFVGLRNYTALLHDEYFRLSLYNTFFMFLELPGAVILGIATAMLLNRAVRGMPFFRTIYYLPSLVPVVASAMLWLWVLNPQHGLVNGVLTKLGMTGPGWFTATEWTKPSFIVMDLWAVGWAMVIYLAALQGVPQQLYEAAELDGAGPWQKTVNVTLPSISPVIFFMVVTGMIGLFQYFTQSFIVLVAPNTGPENSGLFYALYLFYNAFHYFRMGYACAMAWILFVVTLIITLIVFRTSARWVYYEAERG